MNEPLQRDSSYLCHLCGAELPTHLDYAKHRDDHKIGKIAVKKVKDEPQSQPEPVALPTIDRKPIKLKYVFEGQCLACGKEVTTLEIDVKGVHFCLAYCIPCKEERANREVVQL